jgi:hypothetical protein
MNYHTTALVFQAEHLSRHDGLAKEDEQRKGSPFFT